MSNKHHKCFLSAPKSYKIKKLDNFEPQIKKVFNLHFDSHFVSCSYGGDFRRHFDFFHLNLLVSSFYFWSTMLTEINHTINMSTFLAVYL